MLPTPKSSPRRDLRRYAPQKIYRSIGFVRIPGREEQVLHTRGQLAPERRQQVERLFRLLMELSREEQA